MVRVGFHLHNDGQETVDCSRIIYGNPGIGGAEYAIIAIAYMLSVDKNASSFQFPPSEATTCNPG